MTPVTEQIWSFQFCSSEHPAHTELKHFPKRGRRCANRHWHAWSCQIWVSCWISWCLCAPWAFSTLHGRPGCMGRRRWGGMRTSTISFPELNPPGAGKAKSNHCSHFAEWGHQSRGEERDPEEGRACVCPLWGPCKSSTSSGFVCFLVALGTALDLISAEPTFAEPFVNHLTLAQTCWEHQSHLPDHNVPSFSFFPSFLSLLLQPT